MLGTIATVWAYFLQRGLEVAIAVGTSTARRKSKVKSHAFKSIME
ncbi:hypothetical protein [Nostoc sp.]